MIGELVGNYKIVRALGEGGVGMVYQGVDTMLDREVAIKVLRPELASQNSVVERFRSEAVTLAKLNHPNIATLYSLFRQGDELFMVLEFIRGETLDHILYRRGVISSEEAIPYFCQALEGINYAHERGIIHRDIKPGNMMLAQDGTLKVLDFGIARLLGSNRMTRIGNVIGTLEYMSPEQVKGLETDARSDIYGLGVMLYEILTGKLPFESENDFELMKMQTEMIPRQPRSLNPDIPVEVEKAIMKAVSKNPDERFQSAGDFLNTFLELGFAIPNSTFANFKKNSRPSNAGLKSDESVSTLIRTPQTPIIANLKETTNAVREEAKDAISQNTLQENEVKGTRLATPAPIISNELKATRLGNSNTVGESIINYQKSPSFFDKLGWMHYAGASAIALILFSFMAMALVLPSLFAGSSEPKESKPIAANTKSAETPKTQTTNSASSEPASQPSQGGSQTLQTQTENQTQPKNLIPINPVSSSTNTNPTPTQNQPTEKEKVRNNPTPKPQPQPSIRGGGTRTSGGGTRTSGGGTRTGGGSDPVTSKTPNIIDQ